MATTAEQHLYYSGKNFGMLGYFEYNVSGETITLNKIWLKQDDLAYSYEAYYRPEQTVTIKVGALEKEVRMSNVSRLTKTYYSIPIECSCKGNGNTLISFSFRGRSSESYTLTFSENIFLGGTVDVNPWKNDEKNDKGFQGFTLSVYRDSTLITSGVIDYYNSEMLFGTYYAKPDEKEGYLIQNASDTLNTNDGKIFLEPKWTAISYKCEFDLQGGSGEFEDLECRYDKDFTLPTEIPVRQYYTFKHWSLTQGGEKLIKRNNLTKINEDIVTIYAVWDLNPVESNNLILSCSANRTGDTYSYIKYTYEINAAEVSTENGIVLQYKKANDTDWTTIPLHSLSERNIEITEGIAQNTDYYVRLGAKNASNSTFIYTDDVKITTGALQLKLAKLVNNNGTLEWAKGWAWYLKNIGPEDNPILEWKRIYGIYRLIQKEDGTMDWGGQDAAGKNIKRNTTGNPSDWKKLISTELIYTTFSVHGTASEIEEQILNAGIQIKYTYDKGDPYIKNLTTTDIESAEIINNNIYQIKINNINEPLNINYTPHEFTYTAVSVADGTKRIQCYYSDLMSNGVAAEIKPKIKVTRSKCTNSNCAMYPSAENLGVNDFLLVTEFANLSQVQAGKTYNLTVLSRPPNMNTLGHLTLDVLEDPLAYSAELVEPGIISCVSPAEIKVELTGNDWQGFTTASKEWNQESRITSARLDNGDSSIRISIDSDPNNCEPALSYIIPLVSGQPGFKLFVNGCSENAGTFKVKFVISGPKNQNNPITFTVDAVINNN